MYMYMYTSNRTEKLTWHDGVIPPQELWIKMGGDKGGDSMKVSFQLCNVPHPNSAKNSCVFAIFEAPDTTTNLHIALDPFKPQINALCGKKIWRYMTTYANCCSIITLHITLKIHQRT